MDGILFTEDCRAAPGGNVSNARILIWSVMPNHYQAAFFKAIRAHGAEIQVCYYETVPRTRLELGWDNGYELPEGEQFVPNTVEALECVADWRERIHVVPGCGDRFLRQLARLLSQEKVDWVHWSEPSHPGIRRLAGWPQKRWYANLINRHALGALGIGQRALDDFKTWGVRCEKLAFVPYSSALYDPEASKDEEIERFTGGRHPVFLFLGALCRRKGIDILLRAFAKLQCQRSAEPVLVLVGNDRSGGEYTRLAQTLGIAERVLFRSPMPPPELGKALRCGDVLCLPSRFDGWGVVLNEAASMGLGIIASEAVGAAAHLIELGQNGYRVRTGDIESLSVAMQSYVNDPELACLHGERSLRLFQDFTPQRNAQRFLAAVESFRAMRVGL
jgi:glycosyltransferase involved in cell wall biosynthesis